MSSFDTNKNFFDENFFKVQHPEGITTMLVRVASLNIGECKYQLITEFDVSAVFRSMNDGHFDMRGWLADRLIEIAEGIANVGPLPKDIISRPAPLVPATQLTEGDKHP